MKLNPALSWFMRGILFASALALTIPACSPKYLGPDEEGQDDDVAGDDDGSNDDDGDDDDDTSVDDDDQTEPCDCSEGDYNCLSLADTLQMCTDGCNWTFMDCADVCVDAGYDYSTGCDYSSEFGHDTCFCDNCDCSSGDYQCVGDESLNTCDDGCNWTLKDCETLCLDNGYDVLLGCEYSSNLGHDACICDHCECSKGDVECAGTDSINTCLDGCQWVEYDCDDICQQGGYSSSDHCGYSEDSGHDVCWCVN